MNSTCTATASGLFSGIACDREADHPGMHRDNDTNVYWTPGAPPLEYIDLTVEGSARG